MIPVYQPYIPKHCLQYAHDALDSGWISQGKYKKLATEHLQELTGIKYILLTVNGTAATHLTYKCLKYKYPSINKIIVPNNVYVAVWNSLLFDTPTPQLIPIDADEKTWNMDTGQLKKIRSNEKIGVSIVHNLGNIINVPELIRTTNNLVFIEDNCEGFLGKYEKQYSGMASLCSSISFFGNKTITCGEGGAFCTNDKELYDYAFRCHGQGQSQQKYIHDMLGYNYRLTNVSAAILYGQLQYLNEILEKKTKLFELYHQAFSSNEHILLQEREANTIPANWMMGIRILNNKSFEEAQSYFNNSGIDIRPMFYPMSYHQHLSHLKNDEHIATLLSKECFIIPSYPDLSKEEINKVIATVKSYAKEINK